MPDAKKLHPALMIYCIVENQGASSLITTCSSLPPLENLTVTVSPGRYFSMAST
jgi:hypothetical protein